MAIQPGQSLLHYRIVEKIGEGGMGEVWKAVDTSLDRDVAIKILPEAFADDADRLARFDREAKLVASLHHPNIGRYAEADEHCSKALEHDVGGRPEYAPHRAALGLAHAGLRRKEDAVREGRRAVDLMPIERDSLVGSWQLGDLGFIYVQVGDHQAAVDTFEQYLSRPSLISAKALALDPRLESMLDIPRFRDILNE